MFYSLLYICSVTASCCARTDVCHFCMWFMFSHPLAILSVFTSQKMFAFPIIIILKRVSMNAIVFAIQTK